MIRIARRFTLWSLMDRKLLVSRFSSPRAAVATVCSPRPLESFLVVAIPTYGTATVPLGIDGEKPNKDNKSSLALRSLSPQGRQ